MNNEALPYLDKAFLNFLQNEHPDIKIVEPIPGDILQYQVVDKKLFPPEWYLTVNTSKDTLREDHTEVLLNLVKETFLETLNNLLNNSREKGIIYFSTRGFFFYQEKPELPIYKIYSCVSLVNVMVTARGNAIALNGPMSRQKIVPVLSPNSVMR